MKNIKKSPWYTRKKILTLAVLVVVLAIGAVTTYAAVNEIGPFEPVDKSSDKNKESGDPKPKDSKDESDDISSAQPDTKPDEINQDADKTTNDVPVKKASEATITELVQRNNQVYFAAKISNATKAGRCIVSFTTPNDRPVIKEFDGKLKGDTAYCGRIVISELEFSYLGEWKATLRYYVGSKQVTTSKNITIS